MKTYFVVINLVAFITFVFDKSQAIKDARRIPEAVLFALALIGGALGAFIAMWAFHHKTRHKLFNIGIPLVMAVQLIYLQMTGFFS